MPTISRTALVNHTPEQMFTLVDRVEDYPSFLPWCGASQVLSREGEILDASITIAKGAVNKSFSTRNINHEFNLIEMSLLDGPFKHLNGVWRFDDLQGEACKISLELEFEFSNRLVSMAIGPIFNQVANTLVDAFVERANKVYG